MTDLAAAAAPSTHALLAASPDGVLTCDRDLRITAWNPALERLTGVAAAAALGREPHDALPALREAGERAVAEAALRGEEGGVEWDLALP
ncbi:MAG TPA: PAS domain-containing protein, partial [Longimicrobiaceae bacterium]